MNNDKQKEERKSENNNKWKKVSVFRFFFDKYENRERIKKSIKTGMSLGNIKEPKMKRWKWKKKNVCFQITGYDYARTHTHTNVRNYNVSMIIKRKGIRKSVAMNNNNNNNNNSIDDSFVSTSIY